MPLPERVKAPAVALNWIPAALTPLRSLVAVVFVPSKIKVPPLGPAPPDQLRVSLQAALAVARPDPAIARTLGGYRTPETHYALCQKTPFCQAFVRLWGKNSRYSP